MATVDSDDSFKAKIQYLARDDQHQLVKPYYLYFEYDSEIAPTNTTADDRFVHICNARNLGIPPREMFFEWGFAQLRLDCPLTPEEYCYDKKVEEILYPKYKSIARFLFPNAARVEILEHAVRKRHPLWLSEGIQRHELKTNQPSDYVHVVDYASQATAMDIVTRDYVNENTRIYFDEKHKWYYWHGLQVDEVIAFIQADSQAENRAGMMDYTPIF
ncbi:uncharacterized protein CDV56_100967 [Aspergillus thermomutatus]|uniref:Uncharacterized protein n=1 Tax=Aspergillus thermomutatus TaxID=41047 RepID=A0A397G171_ASPTH|nr:uncharacterized protein CDV56_100967 [Aspergillus thermomutatus]RHZ43564.1 hypothetical protein CDV56_100967 [Aspergillus thermomutatus]